MPFDERKARRVTCFIEALKHTKGEFHGKPFQLLPWQEKIMLTLSNFLFAGGVLAILISRNCINSCGICQKNGAVRLTRVSPAAPLLFIEWMKRE